MWKFQQFSPQHDILWISVSNCQILSGNVLYVLIVFKDPISDALKSAWNRFNSNKAQLKATNSSRTLPLLNISQCLLIFHDKWVPVTRACRVLRLRMEEWPPIWRVAVNILNKQSRTETRCGPPVWGLGEVLTNPHHKKWTIYETHTYASGLVSSNGTT